MLHSYDTDTDTDGHQYLGEEGVELPNLEQEGWDEEGEGHKYQNPLIWWNWYKPANLSKDCDGKH